LRLFTSNWSVPFGVAAEISPKKTPCGGFGFDARRRKKGLWLTPTKNVF